jgi:hypothetical protein
VKNVNKSLKNVELIYTSKAKYNTKTGYFNSKNKNELVNFCYKVDNKPFYFSLKIGEANYFNSFIKELYNHPKIFDKSGDKKKILFAITANHTIPTQFMEKFEKFAEYNRKFFDVNVNVIENYIIDEGRNQQITFAKSMAVKPDYVFFIDADNTFKYDTLLKLVEANKPVVSGIYFQRNKPYYPVAFKNNKLKIAEFFTEFRKGKLEEVDYVGAGCLLVKMKVLNKMKYPYWYMYRNIKSMSTIGEDIVFCGLIKNLGYKIYLHCGTEVGHIGGKMIDISDWEQTKELKNYIPNLQSNIVDFQNKVKKKSLGNN